MQARVRFTVEENYRGWRLDRYLQEKIRRLSRAKIQWLIAERLELEGGGGERLKPSTRVVPGLTFVLVREAEPEPATPLEFGVLYDDGALLAVDKPAGLPVHPTARYAAHTFTALARARFPDRKVDPAHRIDRETSGVLACGCAPEHTGELKRSFARGDAHKTYLALVEGAPGDDAFAVDAPLALTLASMVRVRMHVYPSGLASRTRFEVLERRREPGGAPITLLACFPDTGRQHQIRAHLFHAGLPIVGDKIYGPDEGIFDRFTRHEMTEDDRARLRIDRHALHAWRLTVPHPVTRRPTQIEAPLPDDLAAFWRSCSRGEEEADRASRAPAALGPPERPPDRAPGRSS